MNNLRRPTAKHVWYNPDNNITLVGSWVKRYPLMIFSKKHKYILDMDGILVEVSNIEEFAKNSNLIYITRL